MSWEATAWAAKQRCGSPQAKLVLFALANRHNADTGQCDPSIERIADEAEISKRTVYRVLEDLEAAGFVVRERRAGGFESGSQSNQYRFPALEGERASVSPSPPEGDSERATDSATVGSTRTLRENRKIEQVSPGLFPEAAKPKRKSHLPPECPSLEDRGKAKAYWTSKERSDLCGRVDVIADGFRAHHEGKGTLALDWGATWRTWYVNQINYTRAPTTYQQRPGAARAASGPAISDRDRWQKRLDAWLDQGFWSGDWGPPPDQKGCEAPRDLIDNILARRKVTA